MNVSKPDTKPLAPFFTRLQPLLSTATPVVSNFSQAIQQARAEQRPHRSDPRAAGARQVLVTASPANVTALKESVPITAFFGPYSPDLEGFVRDFGTGQPPTTTPTATTRASAPVFPDFQLGANNTLTPDDPAAGAAKA